MPAGAGAATVAWAPESSYLGGLVGTPTYRLPGTNTQVQTAELSRNQARIDVPDSPEADRYLAQNFRGQLGVQFALADDEFHRLVFNDGYTGFDASEPNSAEWFLGADLTSGTTIERNPQGWVPGSCSIDYNGTTELVTVTLTGPYGDETENSSLTPGVVTDPTDDEVPGHGAELKIAGTRVTKLNSASISLDNLTTLIPDSNTPQPVDAVPANVEESITLSAIYDGPDLYEYALGSAGASSVEDTQTGVPATVTFSDGSGTVAEYSFGEVKPNSYDWADLVNGDAALGEDVTFNATGITASDPTA